MRSRRAVRDLLAAGRAPMPIARLWRQQHVALVRAMLLVRVFYICLFFTLVQNYPSWQTWMSAGKLRMLWPIGWFRWSGIHAGAGIVIAFSMTAALLASAWPGVRALRLLAAIGILEFGAMFSSFGVVNHGWHVVIWIAAIFVLLPDGSPDTVSVWLARRQRYLRVFWSAQAAMMLFYSMSGAIKLLGAALQTMQGLHSAFSIDGLARHIAYKLQENSGNSDSILGPFILNHPAVGWPLYVAALYLEVFSIFVAFRPSLHRAWGVALIGMHIGVFLMMTIMFSWQMLAVGLLLVCSPFAPERVTTGEVLRQLPVIGDAWWWMKRARSRNRSAPKPPARVWDEMEAQRLT